MSNTAAMPPLTTLRQIDRAPFTIKKAMDDAAEAGYGLLQIGRLMTRLIRDEILEEQDGYLEGLAIAVQFLGASIAYEDVIFEISKAYDDERTHASTDHDPVLQQEDAE